MPRLTTEGLPQWPYTMKTSPKEEHTPSMGIQQYTIVIYIIISFKVTIKTTPPYGLHVTTKLFKRPRLPYVLILGIQFNILEQLRKNWRRRTFFIAWTNCLGRQHVFFPSFSAWHACLFHLVPLLKLWLLVCSCFVFELMSLLIWVLLFLGFIQYHANTCKHVFGQITQHIIE